MKESLICGEIVKNGRETYQKYTFGHGLVMVKLSAIERKLENHEKAEMLEKSGTDILKRCIGTEQTFALLKEEINK